MAQYCEIGGKSKFATTTLRIHVCRVSSWSTSEQRAHYLVHQLDSKTNLSKHTSHHPLIDVLQYHRRRAIAAALLPRDFFRRLGMGTIASCCV